MSRLLLCTLKILALSALFFSTVSNAQNAIATPDGSTTYIIKPDYRKCAYPLCGGWFLTPVNQHSLRLENEDESYENSLLLPQSIYVSSVNYRRMGLTPEQVKELEMNIYNSHVLVRGIVSRSTIKPPQSPATATLVAIGAWTSANKNPAVGPYLKISSSGIMCITTPCPYYNAELLNSSFMTQFHELNLEKAELDREQTARAWQDIATQGLIMTGIKYQSQGMTGPGTGIAATQVFFAFPGKQ